MCALSVAILSLGSVIEIIDITTAALASFLVIITVIELKGYFPILLYVATSVLSFLILPNKTVTFMYVLFFGFYPILKRHLERLKPIYSWIAKFIVFNIMIFIYVIIADKLFFLGNLQAKIYLVILLNIIFFTLDIALTIFITSYVRKLRKLLQIHRFFK